MRSAIPCIVLLSLASCGGRSIGLTDLGSGDGQAVDSAPLKPGECRVNAGCRAGEYCRLPSCSATTGQCEERPDTCPLAAVPPPRACGCDGMTYTSGCEAARAGVSVARVGACTDDPACEHVRCSVINDCCECRARDTTNPHPTPKCPAICEAPVCDSVGMADPFAYCLSGLCLLGGGAGCASDTNCQLVNDCCRCMAVPVALAKILSTTCPADCFQDACSAMGLAGAKARCVGGHCRLGF